MVSKRSKTLLKRSPDGPKGQVTETVSLRCHNGKHRWTNYVGRFKTNLGRILDESWTGWSRYGHGHVTKTKDPLYSYQ